MRPLQRSGALLIPALLLTPLASESVAGAATTVRTGWWNTATVSGVALPSTTSADALHLAAEPSGTLAFAAVSVRTDPYAEATLTLHVAQGTEVGTPAVMACPTENNSWKTGGDQPQQAAPAYACAGRAVTAVVGTDATGVTLTFLLDPTAQLSPGLTSLALVPVVSTTSPFSLDLTAPESSALRPAPVATTPAPSQAVEAPTSGAEPTAGPVTNTAPVNAGPPDLQAGTVPVPSTRRFPPAVPAPAVATDSSPTAVPSNEPPTSAPLTSLPVLPRGQSRRDAAVLLLLVLGALGYTMTQHRRTPPTLIGGRARAALPEAALPGPAKGIGRFARPRTQPARRLL